MRSPSQTSAPLLQLNAKFGPYHLERLIAVGGMAEIYLAHAKGLAGFEKRLALKVINSEFASDEQFVRMLVQEAKVAVSLNHANIVKTFDLGKIGAVYFISMEFVDGPDYFHLLKQLASSEKKIPIPAAVFIAREVAAGLAHAHSRTDEKGQPLKLIHRDISPQNILLSREGAVKIADFGVAKVANVSSRTQAGVIKGKLVYMSPEQAWGEDVDQRSDIFSAGIVLYEAITGRPLYTESHPVRLLHQVRSANIQPPSLLRPEINPELDILIMKAIARDRDDRYETAAAFEAELTAYLLAFASDFKARSLASLVQNVEQEMAAEAAHEVNSAPPKPQSLEPMKPDDFAQQDHSIVGDSDATQGKAKPSETFDSLTTNERSGVAKIVINDEGKEETFEVGETFTIGRGGELRLNDGRVSRRHARVTRTDTGNYTIEDLDSSNGTYVNRIKVEGKRPLFTGDVIYIGPYEMTFVLEAGDFTTTRRDEGPRRFAQNGGNLDSFGSNHSDAASPNGGTPDVIVRSFSGGTADDEHSSQSFSEPSQPTPIVAPSEVEIPLLVNEDSRFDEADEAAKVAPSPNATAQPPRSAYLCLATGDESLHLPIQDCCPLNHTIAIGEHRIVATTGVVVMSNDDYWIEPAPGHKGVSLNGKVVTERHKLEVDDEIRVGPLTLKFHSPQ